MDFFKNAADSVTRAVNYVVDKNRRAALVNRLKAVIKTEKEKQARAYIELGKYYYETMRDAENGRTEPQCAAIDDAGRRLKKAYAKLDELVVPAGQPCTDAGCGGSDPDEKGSGQEPAHSAAPQEPPASPKEEEAASDDEEFLRPFSAGPDGGEADRDKAPDGREQGGPGDGASGN